MPYLSSLVSPVSTISSNTDANPAPVKLSSTDDSIAEIAFYLGKLVKMSEALAVVDTNQRQRITIDTVGANIANPLPIVPRDNGGVTVFNQAPTVYGSSNQNSLGNYGGIGDFWRQVEYARQNYQNSIRSNLSFS